ncbi:GEVED domain-containing protein [Rubripirellula amarantea]|nr:GEVED domain-containing protein [Rubripirellula amarantea]
MVRNFHTEILGLGRFIRPGDLPNGLPVGDLYGGDERAFSGDGDIAVVTRDRNGDGIDDLGVMDFQDFDESTDDQFGGEFFRGAFFVVGQLLGYGYADDLPQPVTQSTDFIFAPGTDNEPAFPALADILHGQYLYRPDSTDIDLYRFSLSTRGTLSIETMAERLSEPSLLDTTLRLYRLGANGAFEEIARNDDYFSNDSLIDLVVDSGTYAIGVSARGNDSYDPNIEDSGIGGLSEGKYELLVDFKPSSTNAITDTTGIALDGDGDNRPGGVFDFWFVPSDSNNTLYVDKAASGGVGPLGTVGNAYREIDQALAAARPGDTVRVVGNGGTDGKLETPGDNFSYQIGFASNGTALEDGSSLNLPQGVRMVIDSGAILKLSGSRIGIGSVSPLIDVSDSALQVLGTPSIVSANGLPARDSTNSIIPGSVYFTSINDRELGMGNSPNITSAAQPGDWGGIDFRGDLDTADESRRNRENEGVFLNHIQGADIRYGGGSVSIGGRSVVVSPVDMAITRATIINSVIQRSADAAIAATPDTFAETRFTTPFFQDAGVFTPDFERVGPQISGNTIIDNSINGLFIRVVTRTGDVVETIKTTSRFDDTDITHVLAENLVIEGTAGGPILQSSAPSSLLVRLEATDTGNIAPGTYSYRITNVDSSGLESAASQPSLEVTLTQTGGISLTQLPAIASGTDFVSRRLYRATIDPVSGLPGPYQLVEQLNASSTSFVDRDAAGTSLLPAGDSLLRSRLDASLVIDPGTVLKLDGARIEARFGADLIAEGLPSLPIVFTSIEDNRYGAGGTFDTNDRGENGELTAGDWGGIYIGHAASASIDQAVIAGAGGRTRIEGGFASFNALEVHQADLRLANTRFEQNADGRSEIADDRVGRGDNASGTVFVRASNPIIVNNAFVDGESAALSFDINSFSAVEVNDPGRSTGNIDQVDIVGNSGPLIEGNVLDGNSINGVVIRGGQLATAGVWDDVDIVHVVQDSIEIPNQHVYGGLKLQSDARGSLVVKFQSADGETAGIVVGGSLLTATDEFGDIADRIGGSLQVVGHPDFPVVLTTLADDTSGAGFKLDGTPQVDTNNDGVLTTDLSQQPGDGFIRLPTGPEVNRGNTIDNDVDVNTPGYFEATITSGNDVALGGVTVEDLTNQQTLVNQNYIFAYTTYIEANGTVINLGGTTVTQAATLIADDVVESRGTFTGAGGTVEWIATSFFLDGVARLTTRLELDGGDTPLGDLRVVSYLDEDINLADDDILVTSGTPGAADFRAYTLDGPSRVGFAHGGFYLQDGSNLVNANYEGWAADQFNELETAILAGTQTFSVAGDIDLVDLPQAADADFGSRFGPNDVTTAFAWRADATATTSTITSFLELLSADPAIVPPAQIFESGLWNGIVVREAADDRNVAAIAEQEPVRTGFIDSNAIPSQSQFLGELAPSEKEGDENRRLGFIIDGAITTRDDLDVYSFVAESNTEVWLDIDRTGNQLDSVVELIDANGRILASSNDSLLAETNPNSIYSASGLNPDAAQPLSVAEERITSQEITISESIVDATGGNISLAIAGQTPVLLPLSVFVLNPAEAIENALSNAFSDQLGTITATLNRRAGREFSPTDPNVITRFGDDFVVQLRFDSTFFIGRDVPQVQISTVGITGPSTVTSSVAEKLLGSQLQDAYSSNPKDAGMRITLPGEVGTRNLYHIRVRSANTKVATDLATLVDPAKVRDGLSRGNYQLQIRLSEVDEHAGTQVRLADVRYATTGLQIIGQPLHSPLLGEEQEIPGDSATAGSNDPNNSLAEAQPLGYYGVGNDATSGQSGLLQSDQASKSFGGSLVSATDVDWYSFTVGYDNLTRDQLDLHFATVFDLDYASGFARADMAMYVFNAQGQLILVGGDSNVADDLPGLASSNNTDDLSRGSAGAEDPYIGVTELSEGTYYIAISNQQQVPLPMDQFFNANSANPLLRLEPIDSIRRIAEDRIGISGGGTASLPEVPVLFDQDSIIDYTLDDVLIYVNTPTGLRLVNAFTGQNYGSVGDFNNGELIREIAFSNNGELFSYNVPQGALTDTTLQYHRIDTGTAALSAPLSLGAGVVTFDSTVNVTAMAPDVYTPVATNAGLDVRAIEIGALGGTELGFLVADRAALSATATAAGASYESNILYGFDPSDGTANGPTVPFTAGFIGQALSGAGTSPREIGRITDGVRDVGPTAISTFLGLTAPVETNSAGVTVPSLVDGDSFVLANGANSITFEFNSGFTLNANAVNPILDGQTVNIDGTVFEFNTGQRFQFADNTGGIIEGATVRIPADDGSTLVFQFVGSGIASGSNIPVAARDATGQPLSNVALAANLAQAVNSQVTTYRATSQNQNVYFTGATSPSLTATGTGVTVFGDNGVQNGRVAVNVPETVSNAVLIDTLATAIRGSGITVVSSGPSLSLPDATSVSYDNTAGGQLSATQPGGLSVTGDSTVADGAIAVQILPNDSAADIALRIANIVNNAPSSSPLSGVGAQAFGRSVQFSNSNIDTVTSANNALTRGGLQLGGQVTGVAAVDSQDALFAITDNGALFRIDESIALSTGVRQAIGQPVFQATDLADINFTALRSGPVSFADGELRDTLFGITGNGDIYAFNTLGELQPIFSGGRSVISTGITGAQGFDFSTLGFNLWHVTDTREFDAGHGIDSLYNSTRDPVFGGLSLAFNYEANAFNNRFGAGEQPVIETNNVVANPRQDGGGVQSTYNFPGGAKGVIQSNSFDLEGFSSADEPVLYFNYYLETDGSDSIEFDRDSLRVYVTTADGTQQLVASNNTARGIGSFDDEFDDPAAIGDYDDDIDVDVQQLFDNTGTWRQARISLGEFAGEAGLSLRLEFSSAGTVNTGSGSLGTIAGSSLTDGQQFTIAGETFSIDLAPAVSTPSGQQLAQLYTDLTARATVTIDNQVYVLNDGSRDVAAGEVSVSLVGLISQRGSLNALTAIDVADVLAATIRTSPPPNALIDGLSFSDPQDIDPNSGDDRNDVITGAAVLPYTGGNVTFVGQGQLGNDRNVGSFDGLTPANADPVNVDDVDLIRVNLEEGALVAVNIADTNPNLPVQSVIRFFDQSGLPLVQTGSETNAATFTAPAAGTYFIGISGSTNTNYDARFDDTGSTASVGGYEATIAINTSSLDLRVRTDGNTIELAGTQGIVSDPTGLFTISGVAPVSGVSVPLSRFQSAEEVALVVQDVLADRFAGGNTSLLPTTGNLIRLPGFSIDDPGPFANSAARYGDQFGDGPLGGTRDNSNEGVYLDDFIIGFAERGEVATNSNVVAEDFITDLRRNFPLPANPTSNLNTGTYQVEIRGGSEYVDSAAQSPFRTFDTNTRLSAARYMEARAASELRDGQTFSIFDGRSEVVFEFNQTETGNGVTPGNVEVAFTLTATDPDTGNIRPQTASEVATNIINAINRSDVQSVIDVPALLDSGQDGMNSARINIFADVVITDNDGGLAVIGRNELRGDDNTERQTQGIILVENSRFMFNENYGIGIDHGLSATVNGVDTPSVVRYPRNLVELNSENLSPGVIIQSNVLAYNGLGGLQINGIDPTLNETQSDPVAFDRIVNNTIIGGTVTAGVQAPPQTIQGILFPQGNISFADSVVDYSPDAGGSAPPISFQNTLQALGAPDSTGIGAEPTDGLTTVSLGLGGSITLQFTDNLLTGSGDSANDLIVFETGQVESVRVEISRDGVQFSNVGTVGGLTNSIDIDAFGFGSQDRFAFVRLTDLRQGDLTGAALGADIDAVGALSSVPVETFEPGGTGIELVGNASPVLLNNVIANSTLGVQVGTGSVLPILGGNSYYRNTENVPTGNSVGQFAQELSDAEVIFVSAANLVFAPAAGSLIIDSSIDSLPDRPSLTTVKNPLGLPPSPILAPRLDVNGQLRVDDPNVETPRGLGENVFKDRGASDRGDLVGPRVVLRSPQAPNLGIDAGTVSVLGDAPKFFEIQLIDGLAPADVVPGTGIDDLSVSSGSILLLKDNEVLVEGIDYRYGYNASTNVIRLTPIAGVWEENSTYVIRMIDASDAIIGATAGNTIADGSVLNLRDLQNNVTRFEYETGITLNITPGLLAGGTADGITFDVFDGTNSITFELDDDGQSDPLNTAVTIPAAGADSLIAQALAAAVNASSLNLTAVSSGLVVQFQGTNPLATVTSSRALTIQGSIGTSIGFGLQIPADGADVADTVADGQTFIVRRGASIQAIFEFDDDNVLSTTGAIRIAFNENSTLDQIAGEIVRAVGGAGLGLAPSNEGFGRISLGGNATYSVTTVNSALTQIGFPGQTETVPISISVDQTSAEVAQAIAAAIEGADIAGVSTSLAESRIFVEGSAGVDGVGAIETVTIQDEVGNELQSNLPNGRTELTIFVGSGFDYGDAPAPYISLDVAGGPRHAVDPTFSIGATVTADADARLTNADTDDGVAVGSLQAGFNTNLSIEINNTNNRSAYLDAWFDWNANGIFESDEVLRYATNDSTLPVISSGTNSILVSVPSSAVSGEIYARFRLSEVANLSATGQASSGEVEDYRFVVGTNPFQNPKVDNTNVPAQDLRKDVNDSGSVTPIDALQIINAIGRNDGQNIPLDVLPLPAKLPIYPDVNGDGIVSARDALQVINELARLPNSNGEQIGGEGELIVAANASGYSQVADGVLASGATRLGDQLLAEQSVIDQPVSTVSVQESKTSVFDSPETVGLDSIVDTLAEDTSTAREAQAIAGDVDVRDQLFASF